jgi:radical SAM superfamily enzyme YgiQ (UPF0313 family)
MMKIVLIFPPLRREQDLNITTFMPPLGIATIAAVLENAGYEVKILDLNFLSKRKFSWKQLEESIKEIKPDIVGITCTTPAVINILKITEIIKNINSEIFTVVGGPHASVIPQNLLKIGKCIDFAVIAEGEYTFPELVRRIEDKRGIKDVQGIAYREGEDVILTPKRPYIENLDEIPFPARHLLPSLSEYRFAGHCYNKLPVTSMITSRGCPHGCNFCSQGVFGRRYRARSAESVVSEMEHLVTKYNIKSLMIVDDTFTVDRERICKICELIINRGLDVSWLCYAGVQDVDKDMLIKMKKAGCYQIYYGIESGTQRILNIMNKGVTIEQIKAAVKYAKEVGIEVRGQFMFGYPTETPKEIRKSIVFAKKLRLDYAEFGVATPLPGSELYNWAISEGKFRLQAKSDFEVFKEGTGIFMDSISSLANIDNRELVKYVKKAYRNFYLRFKYILRRFFKMRNLTDIKKNLQAFSVVTVELSKFYRR